MIELARQEIMELEDPELWFAWTKDEITEGAKTKLNAQLLSSMRQREFEWLARREGIIDAEMYDSYSGVIPLILGTERIPIHCRTKRDANGASIIRRR